MYICLARPCDKLNTSTMLSQIKDGCGSRVMKGYIPAIDIISNNKVLYIHMCVRYLRNGRKRVFREYRLW